MTHWLAALHGTHLLLLVCVRLFLEETGIPMPFAPGDLLFVLCGVAVSRD